MDSKQVATAKKIAAGKLATSAIWDAVRGTELQDRFDSACSGKRDYRAHMAMAALAIEAGLC